MIVKMREEGLKEISEVGRTLHVMVRSQMVSSRFVDLGAQFDSFYKTDYKLYN